MVFVGERLNHRDSGREAPGWVGFPNPPEVPLCPRGDAIFIEGGAVLQRTDHTAVPLLADPRYFATASSRLKCICSRPKALPSDDR